MIAATIAAFFYNQLINMNSYISLNLTQIMILQPKNPVLFYQLFAKICFDKFNFPHFMIKIL